MNELVPIIQPDVWLQHIFEARAARIGGIVRRQVRDVERIVGRGLFVSEVQRRGFHLVENAGQFVIFCNNTTVKVIC